VMPTLPSIPSPLMAPTFGFFVAMMSDFEC
jgi:hypothetical protein